MYAIALDNKKCSCTWEYVKNLLGETIEFETKEEATDYGIENDLSFEVVEI